MEKRAVILDFDGVIMDTESAVVAAWRSECAASGLGFDEQSFVATVGVPSLAPERVTALLGEGAVDPLAFAARVRKRIRLASVDLPVLPGVRELLAEAAVARVPVAVASGASREWVYGHLARASVLPDLAAVVCREDARAGKPAPDLYLAVLARLHVPAGTAVAVEDSLTGVTAALAAGVRCIAVPGPTTRAHDLSAAEHQLTTLAGVGLDDLFPERL